MKFKVVTENPEEIERAFTKLGKDLLKKGRGTIASNFLKEPDGKTFRVLINYPLDNRAMNWMVMRQFKSTLKKIDPKIKFKKLK